MKFGKLSNIDLVDFSLLPTTASSITYLQSIKNTDLDRYFYIGCTGWSMKEWLGNVYPKKAKTKDFLKYYGEQFNTIELNTTHYRIPTVETIEKWSTETPKDFRFCPKIPQTISHSRDLGLNSGNIQLFIERIALLEEKIGCCFIQLPPYFDVTRLALLQQFINAFPQEIPLAIELRHESWFKGSDVFRTLMDFCRKKGIATVITDVAGRRDVSHMEITSNKTMIRFVGNGLHPTDYARIDEWVLLLKEWFKLGLKEVYFFPHQPDNILAPQMARYLFEQVEQDLKSITRGPDLDKHQQGEQMSLF